MSKTKLNVNELEIVLYRKDEEEFISLTDMAKFRDSERTHYIIQKTEHQRLKEIETNQYNLEWNVKRILSKTNYHIHTDAIKNFIIPDRNYEKEKEWIIYAEEADLLNVALFNCTAKDWRDANPNLSQRYMNIRGYHQYKMN
jgi:hypothetical protein